MTRKPNKADDVTSANKAANKAFTRDMPRDRDNTGNDVTDVNEAANEEFNRDAKDVKLGNRVGGLRGSSD